MKVSIITFSPAEGEEGAPAVIGIIKGSSKVLAKKVALEDLNTVVDEIQVKLKTSEYSKNDFDVYERYFVEDEETGKLGWTDWEDTGAVVSMETRKVVE